MTTTMAVIAPVGDGDRPSDGVQKNQSRLLTTQRDPVCVCVCRWMDRLMGYFSTANAGIDLHMATTR